MLEQFEREATATVIAAVGGVARRGDIQAGTQAHGPGTGGESCSGEGMHWQLRECELSYEAAQQARVERGDPLVEALMARIMVAVEKQACCLPRVGSPLPSLVVTHAWQVTRLLRVAARASS